MRKITEDSVRAFLRREQFCRANMDCDGERLKLHGNVIAEHVDDGIVIGLAGWNTATTRERLRGLLHWLADSRLTVHCHNHEAFLSTYFASTYDNEGRRVPAYLRGRVEMSDHERYLIKTGVQGIEAITLWRA